MENLQSDIFYSGKVSGLQTQGISVIICCYNSAELLPETMEHLAQQSKEISFPWELIIVDNNSRDNTSIIAQKEWEKYELNIPLKVVTEPEPGLIHARKKGISESLYPLLLFCDDDNWLESGYMKYAFETMGRFQNVAVLAGRSRAVMQVNKPVWFDRFQKYYAVGEPLPSSGFANSRKYLAGAGMVVRKSCFEQLESLQFENLLTGRKGDALLCGEDSEWCLVFLMLGYDLYYDERLQFVHFIESRRLNWSYCVEMVKQSYGGLQIYYDLYYICNVQTSSAEIPDFEHWYNDIRQRNIGSVLGEFKGIKKSIKSLRYLILPKKGSMKEIQLKANLSRIIYLLKHKKRLKSEFATLIDLFIRIRAKQQVAVRADS